MQRRCPCPTIPRLPIPSLPSTSSNNPPPGKTRVMTPTPDHGEESYRGSGKLAGKAALITGADSGIGGVDKFDETELHVPGNGAGNVDKDSG